MVVYYYLNYKRFLILIKYIFVMPQYGEQLGTISKRLDQDVMIGTEFLIKCFSRFQIGNIRSLCYRKILNAVTT